MSAGNLIGSIFNTLFFGGLWLVLSYAMEKVFRAFNYSISLLPTFQDSVTGLSYMQTIWVALLIILLIAIWANYMMNENSQSSGGV